MFAHLTKRFLIAVFHRTRPAAISKRAATGAARGRGGALVRAKRRGQKRRLASCEPRAPRSRAGHEHACERTVALWSHHAAQSAPTRWTPVRDPFTFSVGGGGGGGGSRVGRTTAADHGQPARSSLDLEGRCSIELHWTNTSRHHQNNNKKK
jgi:hypothetical protein